MKFLSTVLSTAAANLALDEALLDEAESECRPLEVLRLWESPEVAVVIGRSSRFAVEVKVERCEARGVPVLRRCSGGAAVVIGPGCLMYSLVLSYRLRPHLRSLDEAHSFVLGEIADAIGVHIAGVSLSGTSDLSLCDRKFSGNSLRCKRDHFLYHGTILCQFPVELIEELLRMPPRQPEYRADRTHLDFVCSLGVPADELKSAIKKKWSASRSLDDWPRQRTTQLLNERYRAAGWNRSR